MHNDDEANVASDAGTSSSSTRRSSRRAFLKYAVMGGGVLGLGTCLLSPNQPEVATRLAFDPEIYRNVPPDIGTAEDVIPLREGFSEKPPNIIVILTDDMGYGDLSCFGSTSISAPPHPFVHRRTLDCSRADTPTERG